MLIALTRINKFKVSLTRQDTDNDNSSQTTDGKTTCPPADWRAPSKKICSRVSSFVQYEMPFKSSGHIIGCDWYGCGFVRPALYEIIACNSKKFLRNDLVAFCLVLLASGAIGMEL